MFCFCTRQAVLNEVVGLLNPTGKPAAGFILRREGARAAGIFTGKEDPTQVGSPRPLQLCGLPAFPGHRSKR